MSGVKRHASDASLNDDHDNSPPLKSKKLSKSFEASDPSKKLKKSAESSLPAREVDDEGNPFWALSSSGHRRVGVSEFRGTVLVGIRDVYFKDGKCLPAKKGISLTVEQYTALVQILPAFEIALKEKGIAVPRPVFDVYPSDGDTAEDGTDKMKGGSDNGKRNFEATSDEESS